MIDNESLPGLPESIDVPAADLESMAGMPLRAQQIGALIASGFTPADIDRAFALTDGTARQYKSLYFSKKNIQITPQTRNAIIAGYLRAKSVECLTHIDGQKLRAAGVGELAKSAGLLLARADSLEGVNRAEDIGARISAALSKLAQVSNAKQITANNDE
jgi:hypothetical protein